MRKFIFLSFLLVISYSISAQNFIRGKVLDEDNLPLSKVIVTLPQSKQTATTNEKGEFEFRELKDYAYKLTAKYIGYETSEQIVRTGSTIIVRMKPLEIQLEDVVVTATDETAGNST
ncbi:MAG: TonB-dependent receptor [Bacteroidetes bacterium]|nr:TonB-dependent receptor [Bacteroidota bacterium]